MLLSSLWGAAVTSIQIDGVAHEFTAIPHVKEDVTEVILNLKKLRLKAFTEDPITLTLDVKGPADVRAGNIQANNYFDGPFDQLPDNFSLTFALPACHFADQTSTYDVTGVLRVSDPQPGTADMALTFGLENFKLAFNGTGGAGYVVRDGTGSVSVASTGLSQSQHWTEAAVVTGVASASASLNWTSTFAAVQGQSITAGHALPDGVYQPNGSVTFSQANRTATFSVETIDPLQYSATCAAGVAQGTSVSPFSAGRVRVTVTNQQVNAYADVTYSSCNAATVVLVSQ